MSEDQDIAFKEGKAEGRDEAEREMRDEIERLRDRADRMERALKGIVHDTVDLDEEPRSVIQKYCDIARAALSDADSGGSGAQPSMIK